MTKESITKRIQETEILITRAWNAYQQLLGQLALLREQFQELEKETKDNNEENQK